MSLNATDQHAIRCDACGVEAPIAGKAVLLVHRRGCPLGAVLVEAEASGKPVFLTGPDLVVRVFSTLGATQ